LHVFFRGIAYSPCDTLSLRNNDLKSSFGRKDVNMFIPGTAVSL